MKFNKNHKVPAVKSDKFLKFEDGETKHVVLAGEIFEFYMKWVNGKSVPSNPQDPDAKVRFKVNAIVSEEGKLIPKIWEFPLTVYNQLADINSEYPLEETKLKVTRQGTGTDTVYHILPLLKEKVPASIKSIELNVLGNSKPKNPKHDPSHWEEGLEEAPEWNEPMPDGNDEIPF